MMTDTTLASDAASRPDQMSDAEIAAEIDAKLATGELEIDTSPIRPAHFGFATRVARTSLGEEFATLPVYLLSVGEIPSAGVFQCYAGWTSVWLDLDHEQDIRELMTWKGRGFCAVVNCNEVARKARERKRPYHLHLAGLVLHELAHWLEFTRGKRPAEREKFAEHQALDLIPIPDWKETGKPEAYTPPPEPWYLHETQFIRLACHLHRRVRGFGIQLSDLQIAGENYGLSPAEDYQLAVGPELLTSTSIKAIANTQPPKMMQELFAADTRST